MARMVWNELIYLAFGWLLWKFFNKNMDWKHLSILTWVILPYLFFSLVATKMQGYVLFIAPAIFIILGLFSEQLLEFWENKKGIMKLGSGFLFLVIILLAIRFGIERVKPFELFESQSWIDRIEKLKDEINQNNQQILIFNEPRYVEAMFYLNCTAYSFTPSAEVIESWKAKGFLVFTLKNENSYEQL